MDFRPLFPDEIKLKLLKKGYTEEDLKPHKLDRESWKKISADPLLQDFWLTSKTHEAHVNAHLKREQTDKKNAQEESDRYTRAMWAGELQGESAVTMGLVDEQRKWTAHYPQFIGDKNDPDGLRNLEIIAETLAKHNWLPTYSNLTKAFEECVLEAKGIVLDFAKVGLRTPPENVSIDYFSAEDLEKLISPAKKGPTPDDIETARINKQSANQYLQEHADELQEKGVSPLLLDRFTQVIDTWISFNHERYRPSPEAAAILSGYIVEHKLQFNIQGLDTAFADLINSDATFREFAYIQPVKTQSVKMSDQGGRQVGSQPNYGKADYEFRISLQKMGSDEYRERYSQDPEFRARVDALDA